MNDLLITNGNDIILHCDGNIDNDAYTHTHVITVVHVKNAIHKIVQIVLVNLVLVNYI